MERFRMEKNKYINASTEGENFSESLYCIGYKMNHASRGRAIIFNHKEFIQHSTRKGSEADIINLKKALLTLGFKQKEISIFEDLTVLEIFTELEKGKFILVKANRRGPFLNAKKKTSKLFMKSKLMKTVKEENHTDRDLLMVFVLTHGGLNDKISAYDGEYSVEKLWSFFTADKCKTLAGKPKIFFVVACRGDLQDDGYRFESTEVDARPPELSRYSIPTMADFLYVFSTVTGFVSYRDITEGTWYIKGFCDILKETSSKYDVSFIDFLTAVNGRIATCFQTRPYSYKQIPIFSSTLTKTLYLTKSELKDS